jgi:hypothetical protein
MSVTKRWWQRWLLGVGVLVLECLNLALTRAKSTLGRAGADAPRAVAGRERSHSHLSALLSHSSSIRRVVEPESALTVKHKRDLAFSSVSASISSPQQLIQPFSPLFSSLVCSEAYQVSMPPRRTKKRFWQGIHHAALFLQPSALLLQLRFPMRRLRRQLLQRRRGRHSPRRQAPC